MVRIPANHIFNAYNFVECFDKGYLFYGKRHIDHFE